MTSCSGSIRARATSGGASSSSGDSGSCTWRTGSCTRTTDQGHRPAPRRHRARARSRCLSAHGPTVASVEALFFAKDPQAAVQARTRARGRAARVRARRPGASTSTRPRVVKRAVTGSGRADKSQVAQMVRVVLGLVRALRPPTPPTRWRSASCTTCGRMPAARGGLAGGPGVPPEERGRTACYGHAISHGSCPLVQCA